MSNKSSFLSELLKDECFFQWLLHPTPELDAYWQKKMEENPDLKENTLQLNTLLSQIKVKEQDLTYEDKKILWARIASESIFKKKSRNLSRWFKYAASFIGIIVTLSGLYWTYNKYWDRSSVDYVAILNKEVIGEGKNENIRLILANKEKIEIPEANVELIYNKGGDVQVNSDQIISNTTIEEKGEELQFNQLIVPFGHSSNLVLSDGTKIWVNSGSKLIYPVYFSGNKREIFVEGEAYLEVAKNEKVPFYVKTELWEVKVTGTSFNVCAYKGELTQSVVLATGTVDVKNQITREKKRLKPNQMCLYDYDTGMSEVKEVEIYDHICWKYGFLHFKSARLDAVLNRMRRYYNIPLEFSDATKNVRVSGKLDMKKDIDEVFNNIAITAPIIYTQKKNKIIVDVKPLN